LPVYHQIEALIGVRVEPGAESGEVNEASISGGGAPSAQAVHPITVNEARTGFGVEDYEAIYEEAGGEPDSRAGSHPFQYTTTFDLKAAKVFDAASGGQAAVPAEMAKDVIAHLPAGQLGNPSVYPRCTMAQFLSFSDFQLDQCPPNTMIGVATVTYSEFKFSGQLGLANRVVPIYNLEPGYGEPARFGFAPAGVATILGTALRSNGDYGVDVTALNVPQVIGFLANTLTIWGVPGDPRHDSARGVACLEDGFGPCEPGPDATHPPAFLTLPGACSGAPLSGGIETDSWLHPGTMLAPEPDPSEPLGTMNSCGIVPFGPTMGASPTTHSTSSGTGMAFHLDVEDEGLISGEGLAQSEIKKAVVTLPEGFTSNPSVAEGLKACSLAEYEATTVHIGTGCTPESKVGEVEVESPLVEGKKAVGGLFVARQGENPFHNLLTLYLVARNEELGILVKQPLKVEPNPKTGQLTTTVDDIPQLPFSHFRLAFRSGQRAPLITPSACGTYTVGAKLYPWSEPEVPREESSPFQITQGPEGEGCPSKGLPPFHPNLVAGALNNAAGHYSPFYLHMTRRDSEQEITHFSIKLPPGVIGKLAGISECTDSQIAAAKARERLGGGQEELESPSCPANSQIGRTLVGTGVGNVLAYAPGKVYLAGSYHGSAISVVAITAAKVGPFDLGTVVVREALSVNPETAEVFVDATGSDPIPHILDGIPTHLRDIRVYMDRPQFVLNPTNCERTSTASTLLGAGLDFESEADDNPFTATSPFQVAACSALPFAPKLSLALKGKTNRGAHPAFHAHLAMNGVGESGIAVSQVTLPRSEYIENAHFRTICTRVQFKAGAGNGSQCPPGSIYGHAKAITPLLSEPLEGPVFLRSSEHQLPDLVVALHNSQVDFDLVGRVDSVKGGGLRNTFESAPDAPVSSFDLWMDGGKKGLFVNSTNLCARTYRAKVSFTGQNGKLRDYRSRMRARCPKAKRRHGKAHGGRRAKR
jgi:hypothetical protein